MLQIQIYEVSSFLLLLKYLVKEINLPKVWENW